MTIVIIIINCSIGIAGLFYFWILDFAVFEMMEIWESCK